MHRPVRLKLLHIVLAIAVAPAFAFADVPLIEVSSAKAAPGEEVLLVVGFRAGGALVAGLQADLQLDLQALMLRQAGGRPACVVNPDINKSATAFSFQPPGCLPEESCTRFRVLVLAVDNVDPIPDGLLLFTCPVEVADDAPPGTYAVSTSMRRAADLAGNPLQLDAYDGAVLVELPPGATARPTRTPAPTSTPTATGIATTTREPTPTFTLIPVPLPTGDARTIDLAEDPPRALGGADAGSPSSAKGCSIHAGGKTKATVPPWLFQLPLLLLARSMQRPRLLPYAPHTCGA